MRWRLLLRQATSSIGASVALVLIVLVVSGVFTAWPRLQAATFVHEINYQIAQTPATSRALTAEHLGWVPLPRDGWQSWDDALAEVVAGAGPALRASTEPPRYSVSSLEPTEYVSDVPRPGDLAGAAITLRVDPGIASYVRLTAGSFPAPSPLDEAIEGLRTQEEWDALVAGEHPVGPTDMMLSQASAERLGLDVGDEVTLPGVDLPVTLRLSGTFVAVDPDDAQWDHQLDTLQPWVSEDPNVGKVATGIAYVNHESVSWMQGHLAPGASTRVWIDVEPTATDTAQLLTDLRELVGVPHRVELAEDPVPIELRFRSALVDVLTVAVDRQHGTSAVLAMVAAGPAGVTIAVLALGARLAVSRRRTTLALASARGGAPLQIRGALALEGAVLGLPAAVAGAILGTAFVDADGATSDYVLPAVAGLAPALFLATSALPNLRTTRPDLSSRSASRYRWVVEVVVGALAAVCLYVLLGRGLEATTTATVDPLAVGAPLLLSLAAAVLALRVYPLPLRLAHASTRRARGLSGFLGSARAIREGAAGLVPMLALVVGISIAIFSTTMLTTLRGGVNEGATADVGADIRMAGPYFTDEVVEEVRATDGVAEVAAVTDVFNIPLAEGRLSRRLTVVAADTVALARVQEDVPGAVDLPEGMASLRDGRVPVLVAAAHGTDADAQLRLVFDDAVPVELVGQPARAPGVTPADSWVLADLHLLRELTGQALVPRLLLVDVAEGSDVPAVQRALSDVVDGAGTITSPGQGVEAFLESPSAASMQRGFLLALVVSLALSVIAIVMTLVLAAPARGRLLAVLRTLGAGPRVARRLVAWETAPLAIVALAVGTLLGLALPQLLGATVDLRPFTGGDDQPAIRYDPLLLLGVVAALAVVLAGCVALGGALARRLSLSVLRLGDES